MSNPASRRNRGLDYFVLPDDTMTREEYLRSRPEHVVHLIVPGSEAPRWELEP